MQHRDQLLRFTNFVSVQTTMIFVYPAYEALYRAAKGSRYQVPVILLLPMMKVVLKNIMLRFTMHMEDMTPEAVIFTVDFFNALCMATCMQSVTSITAVAIIVIIDLAQTSDMLYALNNRTVAIMHRLGGAINLSAPCNNLLSGIAQICRDIDTFEKQARAEVRVHSCLAHYLSSANRDLIERLDKTPISVVPYTVCSLGNKRSTPFCPLSPVLPPNSMLLVRMYPGLAAHYSKRKCFRKIRQYFKKLLRSSRWYQPRECGFQCSPSLRVWIGTSVIFRGIISDY
ncbi:unnamed protein product [Phytophthora fragariaefolia]|uniref:Unnamed protein product n=1 Tax=Phytophthora fragariaefolia TaxID=1490495 RepID=A0A9W6YDI8_9STRA|nr:unnamed protein product [Phytophthora fragariaefolia]